MLPGFVFCFLLLPTSFNAGGNAAADSSVEQLLQCPGSCVEENACVESLNETDCGDGLVCCVDHLEHESTTEFVDWDFTTQYSPSTTSTPNVELESDEEESHDTETNEAETEGYYTTESEESEDGYTYVYSEESDVVSLEERSGDVSEVCPGMCVPPQYMEYCDYKVDGVCPEYSTCCLTEKDVQESPDRYEFDIQDPHTISKRASQFPDSTSCPGTCVHPSHAMFCEEILPQYPCPLNAKCCMKRSIDRVMSGPTVMECTGQCLPSSMHGYCFPPNELVLGPTTCTRSTTCCMARPSGSFARPPSVNGMQIPGLPSRHSDFTQKVLGHLAIDDMGTVFQVNTNGQVSQLPQLSHLDHMRAAFKKLTVYPRVDGEIAIFSDANGNLYQQFFPHQSSPLREPQRPESPLVRQPIRHFESQASQHAANFQQPTESQDVPTDPEDIVIPDDDDETPVPTTSKPLVHDEKASRPQCPGSCMSYFLRFTCFRGYAIYDGFTCPGRSVCCAKLKDIEDHEQYLKSLSPYFNTPASRDDAVPRCGIKGRRDAPRVIGGKESLPGEWCWQVAIINVQNQYICGGALIDDSWVLTAAHCVIGPMNENQALFVRVGVTDLKSTEDNNRGQTVRVLSTFIHHNFNSVNLDNNIALLRLQKPVELGSNVCVICLPTRGQMPKENTKCTVTGYGFVSNEGDMSLIIREAQVPIIDDMDCMTNVSEALTNPFILPSSSFCAGGNGQQDACQGDAGGPLACEVGGYHELVGLVSWGLGCGRNDVPSIYIKVPAFMGWINQIISSSSFLTSLT